MRRDSVLAACLYLVAFLGGCEAADFQGSARKSQDAKKGVPDGDGPKVDGHDPSDPMGSDSATGSGGVDSQLGGDDLNAPSDDLNAPSSEEGLQEAHDAGLEQNEIHSDDGTVSVFRCSTDYTVPGNANPYLAGSPAGTVVDYSGKISKGPKVDTLANAAPIEVTPLTSGCLKKGARLYFKVGGAVAHGSGLGSSSADGGTVTDHVADAQHGKSDIAAPMTSLIAVFVGEGDPAQGTTPSKASFDTDAKKNYKSLKPELNQIFFVGDGKAGDKDQLVVVPEGAKRLYFGVMDLGQWNNNEGAFAGAILWRP